MVVVTLGLLMSGCFLNVTSYQDKDGSIVYVGEVQNGGAPLDDAVVTGTFYNAAGDVIAIQETSACRVMPTNSTAAFRMRLPLGTAQPAKVGWKLSGHEVADPYLAEGVTGQLFGSGPGFPGFAPAHYGVMTNNSANTYLGGYGCVAWLNSRGEVIRVAPIYAAGLRFNPGASLPFVAYEDLPADAVGAAFFLDAGVTPPGKPLFTVIDLPLSSYTHTSKPLGSGAPFYFQFGELHNSGTKPIYPKIIATTHDAAGVLNGLGDASGVCNVPAAPGGFTYLGYGFTSAAPAGATPAVRLEASIVDHTDSLKPIAVSGVTKTGSGLVTVKGTVKNTTTVTLSSVNVCAATYDSAGNVSSISPGHPTLGAGGLTPGATATFSIDVPTFSTVASVKAVAAGRPTTP
jgi:hypothetical protein